MEIKILRNFPKLWISAVALICITIVGCDSENNSADLAKAIKLESQRAQGTIIELVTIVGDQTRLKPGESHQLRATGIDSNGETRDITNELSWSSSDSAIARVDNKGIVTAIASSMVNRGIVTITGTTINDIYDEGEMSVSDAAVTSITLKQASPETGNINTCIAARIKGDVGYADSYTSLNTVKDMSFSLDDNTSAKIDSNGILYTSSATIEHTSITAKIANISGLLTVTADPQNLQSLDIVFNDKVTTLLSLNVGDRVQVNGQVNLAGDAAKNHFNINKTVSWSQLDPRYAGITSIGENKGTILALKPGVTQLIGSCGGHQAIATLEVKGEAKLDSLQINEGKESITLAPLKSIELTLKANYTSTPASINVSEFSSWTINGSRVLKAEFVALGTDKASYKLTSTSNTSGVAIVSATYDGITSSVHINIE
ncbi:Ig-like domain-containing protein [Paraglaciecola sp.]|uniref:Ig-like domain-containing protein n=1 Tax=Paraglaciecola sp. TaxID=1920173 RepID=UPI0030F4A39F